ncbi:hypothetical protein LQ948_13150 [Jiella sp. MQZ9-1]|uniref:Uncharacterized protein n=1 Tax=Jiella flava TaxID=2816857 RepID=A0A939G200_9HYPH|nr:hypothetical protein [Jiella flava]MBO0663584.1 hypothetical protein [Jiella flava]MCD2472160.1 hypothetical protein [Jiella flava]
MVVHFDLHADTAMRNRKREAMPAKPIVILPKHGTSGVGGLRMPDGTSALVVDATAHRKGLEAADKKLNDILKTARLKGGQGGSRHGG